MSEVNASMDPSSPTPGSSSTSDSLGESLNPPSSPRSPSTASRPLYIPPELLRDIFAAIPRHPSRKRNSTLAALCLVNRTWLAIARPLLYREVRLNVLRRQGLGSISATNPDLPHVSLFPDLVRTVKVTSDAVVVPNDVTRLSALLSLLKDVEAIKSDSRRTIIDGATVSKLVETVILHCPKLRQLELPEPFDRYDEQLLDRNAILSAFPCLESFRGHLKLDASSTPSSSESTVPPFHLKRLVLRSPFNFATFNSMTLTSFDTLRTLAFRLDETPDVIDLSRFHNLTSLHLVHHPRTTSPEWLDQNLVTPFGLRKERLRLRRILHEARSLRISDFALRLGIFDRKMKEELYFHVNERHLDTIVFWARDPSQPPRKCPVELFPSPAEALPTAVHWARIDEEALLVIKDVEMSSVRAVAEFGVKFGLMSSEAASREFENDWEGDSETDDE